MIGSAIGVATLILMLMGSMTAIAPTLMAKFALLPLAAVALLVALLSRSARDVEASTRKIWLVALLAALSLWPSFLLLKSGGLPAIDGRRIVVGCCLLIGIYFFVSRKQVALDARHLRGPVVVGAWMVSGYALLRVVSCLMSPSPIYSLVLVAWEAFYYFSLYFLGYYFFSTDKLRDHAHKSILWLILIITVFACIERFAQENFLVRFAPRNEEFSSLLNSMSSARFRDGKFRAQASFEHPLLLAEYSAIAAAFATSALVWVGAPIKRRWLGAAALVGAVVSAVLTGSRSAYISVAVAVASVLILRIFGNRSISPSASVQARRIGIVIIAGIGLVTALLAVPYLSRGSSSGDQASSEGRILMIKSGLPVIERSPLLGEGPGTGASMAGLKVRSDLVTLDNYLLAIGMESGVPALVLLVCFLVYPVWRAFLSITHLSEPRSAFIAAVAGALLAVLVTRTILWMPYNMSFAYLFAAMALAFCSVPVAGGVRR